VVESTALEILSERYSNVPTRPRWPHAVRVFRSRWRSLFVLVPLRATGFGSNLGSNVHRLFYR
jgi:hypothetical protein